MLMVLDHPEIPLHTNGSEQDIRCQVTKRQVSGGTHSDIGIAFWDYLGARLGVPNAPAVPRLPDIIRCRGQPA